MLGDMFWYGLVIFGVALISFFVFYFIFRALFEVYLEKNSGWYLVGFLAVIGLGYFFSSGISLPICFGVSPLWLCEWAVKFIFIVVFSLLFLQVTKGKSRKA